jgi:hypothetical protein
MELLDGSSGDDDAALAHSAVFSVCCKACGAVLTKRGMKVMLVSDMFREQVSEAAPTFSSDIPVPDRLVCAADAPRRIETCFCQIVSTFCAACFPDSPPSKSRGKALDGQQAAPPETKELEAKPAEESKQQPPGQDPEAVGYRVVKACVPCLASGDNGHYWLFQPGRVRATPSYLQWGELPYNGSEVPPALPLQPPPDELLCAVCSEVLDAPLACPAGHVLCAGCFSREIDGRGKCPLDRQPLTHADLVPARAERAQLASLRVRCPSLCLPAAWTKDADNPDVDVDAGSGAPGEGRDGPVDEEELEELSWRPPLQLTSTCQEPEFSFGSLAAHKRECRACQELDAALAHPDRAPTPPVPVCVVPASPETSGPTSS